MTISLFDTVENTVEGGENTGYILQGTGNEYSLLFNEPASIDRAAYSFCPVCLSVIPFVSKSVCPLLRLSLLCPFVSKTFNLGHIVW